MPPVAIQIEDTPPLLRVRAPYHAGFVADAKRLGGRWEPATKTWRFASRDRARVEQALSDHYGYSENASTVDVLLRARQTEHQFSDLAIFGRTILRVLSRDRYLLGPDVVIREGVVEAGGSRKNPFVKWEAGTEIEVRGLPREAAERLVKAPKREGLDPRVWAVSLLDEEETPRASAPISDPIPRGSAMVVSPRASAPVGVMVNDQGASQRASTEYEEGRRAARAEITGDRWTVEAARRYVAEITPHQGAHREFAAGFDDEVRAFVTRSEGPPSSPVTQGPPSAPAPSRPKAKRAARSKAPKTPATPRGAKRGQARAAEIIEAEVLSSRMERALPPGRQVRALGPGRVLSLPAETASYRREQEDRESRIAADWHRRFPAAPDWSYRLEPSDPTMPRALRRAKKAETRAEMARRLRELRTWINNTRRQRGALLKDVRDLCRQGAAEVRKRATELRHQTRQRIAQLRALERLRYDTMREQTRDDIRAARIEQRGRCASDLMEARTVSAADIDRAIDEFKSEKRSFADILATYAGKRRKRYESHATKLEKDRAKWRSGYHLPSSSDDEILTQLELMAEGDTRFENVALAWKLLSPRERAKYKATKHRSRLEAVLEGFASSDAQVFEVIHHAGEKAEGLALEQAESEADYLARQLDEEERATRRAAPRQAARVSRMPREIHVDLSDIPF